MIPSDPGIDTLEGLPLEGKPYDSGKHSIATKPTRVLLLLAESDRYSVVVP